MTKFRAFGRFMPDGNLQFLDYDYPTEAAFKQDLGGNGFAAKWVLPVDLIEKYDWDAWTSTFGQSSFYGPNYKKLTSKFKQCIKWYEDNKAILSTLYGLDEFYNAASKWVDYDVFFSHSDHYPTIMHYLQALKDDRSKYMEALGNTCESFGEYIDQIKEALKEDSLSHTIDQLTSQDDLNVCFITSCKYDKSEEENAKLHEELYHDLLDLGYGLSKSIGGYKYQDDDAKDQMGYEPSFRVASRNNPEVFKEEMLALGRKYNQETILLKLAGEPAAYYKSKTGKNGKPFKESFKLTEEEYNELPSPGAPYYGLTHWTGNGQIMRAIRRTNLGLTPYYNKKD